MYVYFVRSTFYQLNTFVSSIELFPPSFPLGLVLVLGLELFPPSFPLGLGLVLGLLEVRHVLDPVGGNTSLGAGVICSVAVGEL